MSSILKALKKLEEETTAAQSPQDPSPEVMRRSLQSRTRSRSNFGRLALISVAGLTFLAMIWIFAFHIGPAGSRHAAPAPSSLPSAQPSAPVSADGQAPVSASQTPAETAPPKSPINVETSKTVATVETAESAETVTVSSSGSAPSASRGDGSVPSVAGQSVPSNSREPQIIQPRVVIPRSPSAAVDSRPVSAPVSSLRSGDVPAGGTGIKSAARPNLKLDGILWSSKAQRRQVLISDRYLKEGDEIQGVKIIKIKKNSVTLQRGSDTWTLTM